MYYVFDITEESTLISEEVTILLTCINHYRHIFVFIGFIIKPREKVVWDIILDIKMPVKNILLFRSKTDDTLNEDIYEKVNKLFINLM